MDVGLNGTAGIGASITDYDLLEREVKSSSQSAEHKVLKKVQPSVSKLVNLAVATGSDSIKHADLCLAF